MSTAEREAQRWYERFQQTGVPEHNDAAIGSLTQKLEAAAGVAGPASRAVNTSAMRGVASVHH
jgi:hypothetical protein